MAPIKFLLAVFLAASGALAVLYAHRIPAAVDAVNQIKYRVQLFQYEHHINLGSLASAGSADGSSNGRQWGYTGAPAPGSEQSAIAPRPATQVPAESAPAFAPAPQTRNTPRDRLLRRKPLTRRTTNNKASSNGKAG